MERNEAIEVIKKNYPHVTESGSQFETALRILIPELKESRDERIRKALICHYQGDGCLCNNKYRIDYKEIRAWLEKQGEHANFLSKIQVGDKVTRNEDGVLVNLSQLNRVAKKDEKQGQTFTKKDLDDAYLKGVCDAKHELEKQGEQNHANEVKLKFKYGDRVRNKKSGLEQTLGSCIEDVYEGAFPFHIKDQDDWELVEEPVSIWHDASAKPIKGKIILVVQDNGFPFVCDVRNDIGYVSLSFDHRNKTKIDGKDKWAYIDDLLKL